MQAKGLDRELYMEPPRYIKKDGKIWLLKKPIYGLNDVSRKFWLKVREVFNESRMKILKGDEVFYYCHDEEDNLEGMISSHVNDFVLAGKRKLIEDITMNIKEKLDILKLKNDVFRFTGIDMTKDEDRIIVSMDEYANCLDKIEI